jgi:hypothetical protein
MAEITKGVVEQFKIISVELMPSTEFRNLLEIYFILKHPNKKIMSKIHSFISVSNNYEYEGRSYCTHPVKISDPARKLLRKRLEKLSAQLIKELG